nr:TRASH domain-containing protein [Sulfolobus acidocaldarius]
MQLNTNITAVRCSWCGKVINNEPIVVKTCCNNKPWVFCSRQCYNMWVRDWLKSQEQQRGAKKKGGML